MKKIIHQFFAPILNFFVEDRCTICQQLSKNLAICTNCQTYLSLNKAYCYQCARKLPSISLCGQCLKKPPFYDLTVSPYIYEGSIAHLVKKAKFNKDLSAAKALSELLIQYLKVYYLPERLPEKIVFMPTHKFRKAIKGFSLAEYLALEISKNLNLNLFRDIIKIRNTPLQVNLNHSQRLTNLKNAFTIKENSLKNIQNTKHIALIDDIMTTGASANEVARMLKMNTAIEKIDVWLVARAN